MPHDDIPTNPTNNRPFEDVLAAHLKRRTVLSGGVALAATTFFASSPAGAAVNAAADGSASDADSSAASASPLVGFTSIPLDATDEPQVAPEYNRSVVIPWGTPVKTSGPRFAWPPSPEDQERQIGIGHDGMWFFPTGRGSDRNRRGVLCINHEFGRNTHVLGKAAPESLDDVRTSQAAHGISMVEIRQTTRGNWEVVPGGRRSKRITVNTPVDFSGPAAGSPLLDTPAGDAPTGTLNNCANGYTPWGTYLTCEENFNGYYGATGEWEPTESQARYGFGPSGFGYGWENFDPRFDLSDPDHVNNEHRYGWIVEVDPYRQGNAPVKRTALGRVKHEGIAIAVGQDERLACYMGDDQRFDYIYKFVSAEGWRRMRNQRRSPLDEGTLFVARFNEDGTGDWLELSMDVPALAARFAGIDDLLVNTRLAADIVGATPMDRPEWTTVAPNGDVYCTLTNNTRRTAEQTDAANPLGPNPNGHIIRWHDADNHVGNTFVWDIFLFADDTQGTEFGFGSPDGLWADPDGRIFIQTDGSQPDGANDQMLVADTNTGEIRRLFTSVPDAEVTGIAVTPNRKTMFINIQHPGNGNPEVSQFPSYDGSVPRDATVVLTRKDGGIIGS
ncbi:MAG: PhoX family phosphatase [Actinomycetota bacterium]